MGNVNLLNSLVSDYSQLKEVQAIALGGSSAVKANDNHSDYDIYIYSDSEPPVDERKNIALKYAENPEIDNHYFETGDTYILKETGKPIDIMYRNLNDFENRIKNVWINHNASMGYTTCFVDNINKSQILFDRDGRFKNLQDLTKTPYPEELAKNIINKNFTFLKNAMFSYFDQIKSAVSREDFVSINHRSAAFLASVFDTVFAINKVLHPGEKRLVEFALKNCRILPEDFKNTVNKIAMGAPEERIQNCDKIVKSLSKLI